MVTFQIVQQDIDIWIANNYNEEFDPISNAITRIIGLRPKIERNRFICFNWETAKNAEQTVWFFITKGTSKILNLISEVHTLEIKPEEVNLLGKTIQFNISKYFNGDELFNK